MASQEYLDFEIEIGPGIGGREYPLTVIRSPGGEAHERLIFPFDELALASRLKDLQIALLRSGGMRRQALTSEEQTVRDFGKKLFDALITGETRSRYDVSKQIAAYQKKGLRVKLRIQPPELASLPWEFLYDPHESEYICLSAKTPLVRYIELPRVIQPITIVPPLRILGVTASPRGLATLDVENEKSRVEVALEDLIERKQVDITWQDHATWRDLQRLMRSSRGPWHVLHFIGHGGFNRESDEGFIALEDESREIYRLPATQLGRLIADHSTLRLAILNSCDGAQGGDTDIFSSTASLLVRRGLPAVLAMQYEITDRAAIEFARGFYEAIADGLPVDTATAEARKSVSLGVYNTIEWGTPVLFMRAPDGVLFKQIAPEKAAEIAARERAEKEAAERAAQEKTEREAAEKAAREAAQKEAKEKAEREAAEIDKREKEATQQKWISKERILEAAIEKEVFVDISTELFVYIRRLDSESIISVIKKQVDEEISLDEDNIKSREVIIEFPVKNDQLLPAGITLKLTAHDFYPQEQYKNINILPDEDAGPFSFSIVPKKAGHLKLNLELLKDETSLASKIVRTVAVETKKKGSNSIIIVSIPIFVTQVPSVNIGGNVQGNIIIGDHNQVSQESVKMDAEKAAEIAAQEKAEKEAAERAAREKAEREAAEKAAKEKAAQEKARQEAAKKAAQEKAEREATEKAALEKAKQQAAERAAKEKALREKEKREAAQKAAKERAARRAALARNLSDIASALKPVIRKSIPVLSVVGLFAIAGLLLWFGLKARSSDVVYFTSNRDGKAEIYKLTGSQTTRLTTTSGSAENWSPSAVGSGAVYFTSNRDGKEEIYKLSGGQTIRLTTTSGNAKSWSPSASDAGVVYFTSNRDGKAEIYSLRGGQTTRLTMTGGDAGSWSPSAADAGVVYFVSNRDGKAEIYKLSGGETTRLTFTDGNAESWAPAAADAGVVYFVSNRDGKAEIYKLSEGGTTRLTFTDGSAESWAPLVAGPGVVYFTSNRDGKAEIYKLSEGKTTRLTTTDGSAQSWLTVLNQRLKGVMSIYKY